MRIIFQSIIVIDINLTWLCWSYFWGKKRWEVAKEVLVEFMLKSCISLLTPKQSTSWSTNLSEDQIVRDFPLGQCALPFAVYAFWQTYNIYHHTEMSPFENFWTGKWLVLNCGQRGPTRNWKAYLVRVNINKENWNDSYNVLFSFACVRARTRLPFSFKRRHID